MNQVSSGAAKNIEVMLITPTKVLSHVECKEAFVPTSTGIIEILPDHCALLTEVVSGVFHYTINNRTEFFSVVGGIAYVSNNKLTLLADVAEDAKLIDVDRAKQALERARKRLQSTPDGLDHHRAARAEKRAIARIEAATAHTSAS